MSVSYAMPVIERRQSDRPNIIDVAAERLRRAKRAFATRRLDLDEAVGLATGVSPQPGDLLLAKVVRLGQHAGLQLPCGRRATLFPGDEIIVCYGNRYAPDQFEAVVPEELGPCHLVAGGGIAARARHWHGKMRRPTEIEPLGLLADRRGAILNLRQYRLREDPAMVGIGPRVIAVAGTSMNAGKTTAAAALIRGLTGAGLRVAAAKITGTGAAGDVLMFADAGAAPVVDFTDFGYASTYRVAPAEVEQILRQAVSHLARTGPEIIVLEIADGVFQQETAGLLKSASFRRIVSGIIFAAPDALSGVAGVEWLEKRGLPVLALSGALTASPLAIDEAFAASRLPVLTQQQLLEPDRVRALLRDLNQRADASTS